MWGLAGCVGEGHGRTWRPPEFHCPLVPASEARPAARHSLTPGHSTTHPHPPTLISSTGRPTRPPPSHTRSLISWPHHSSTPTHLNLCHGEAHDAQGAVRAQIAHLGGVVVQGGDGVDDDLQACVGWGGGSGRRGGEDRQQIICKLDDGQTSLRRLTSQTSTPNKHPGQLCAWADQNKNRGADQASPPACPAAPWPRACR